MIHVHTTKLKQKCSHAVLINGKTAWTITQLYYSMLCKIARHANTIKVNILKWNIAGETSTWISIFWACTNHATCTSKLWGHNTGRNNFWCPWPSPEAANSRVARLSILFVHSDFIQIVLHCGEAKYLLLPLIICFI